MPAPPVPSYPAVSHKDRIRTLQRLSPLGEREKRDKRGSVFTQKVRGRKIWGKHRAQQAIILIIDPRAKPSSRMTSVFSTRVMCKFLHLRQRFHVFAFFSDSSNHDVRTQPQEESESSSDDLFAALSEVSAPEPVDREEDVRFHTVSLEETLSHTGSDRFSCLSEVAAPEPVQRRDSRSRPGRPSLEDNFAKVSRKRHSVAGPVQKGETKVHRGANLGHNSSRLSRKQHSV
jgi:hypothetical protein